MFLDYQFSMISLLSLYLSLFYLRRLESHDMDFSVFIIPSDEKILLIYPFDFYFTFLLAIIS